MCWLRWHSVPTEVQGPASSPSGPSCHRGGLAVSWEQSMHGRGEGALRHQHRPLQGHQKGGERGAWVRGVRCQVPGWQWVCRRVCDGEESRGTRTGEDSPSAAHDRTPRSQRLAACSSL